jgi:hypothetical protein
MFGKSSKLEASVAELVEPGEQVLAAVPVQTKGSATGMAVGGIIGGAIAGRGSKTTKQSVDQTGIDVTRFAALAVTPQRVLVLKMNAMGTKAAGIVSSVPLGEVDGIDVDKGKLRKFVTLRARGGTFEFECARGADADTLPDALAKARAGAG